MSIKIIDPIQDANFSSAYLSIGQNTCDAKSLTGRIYQKENGEIVLIPKTIAEVAGERFLAPLIETACKTTNYLWSLVPSAPDLSHFFPLVSATPIEASCDASGSCIASSDFYQILRTEEWKELDRQALVNLRDANGFSLLHAAVESGNEDQVADLVEAFKGTGALYYTDSMGRNALHIAAIEGHHELIPFLSAIPFDRKDEDGLTPLHLAIHEGQVAFVKTLIENGASLVQPWINPDKVKISPLSMAIAAGNPEILKIFMEEASLFKSTPRIGTVLHVAIQANQAPMLEYLLQSEHVITKHLLMEEDDYGRTPLQLAAYLGDLNAIELLYKQDVELNKERGEQEGTAVHYAAMGDKPDAIKLLDYLGADLTATDEEGNTPLSIAKSKDSPEAQECQALLTRLPRINKEEKKRPPNFARRPPENLVFKGGGPKGIAYVGALKQLETLGAMKDVRRIAGTSAGAITAGLLSVGYEANELEQLLGRDFMELLDHKGSLEKSFIAVAQNPTKIQALKALLSGYWSGWNTAFHPVQRAKEFGHELSKLTGLCSGEELREWLDELIEKKTEIPNCTFKELEDLIHRYPTKYKELHIFSLKLEKEGSEITRFSHEEDRWGNLIISDAIRASLSIPGVFDPHTLHFKNSQGIRTEEASFGRFIDGGLLKNYPLDAFDGEKYQEDKRNHGEKTNRRTLGFNLDDQSKPPEILETVDSPRALLQAVLSTFFHAEEILDRGKSHNQGRTVTIPVSIGMLDFNVDVKTKEEMIQNGTKAVDFFLNPDRPKA